MHYNGIMMYFTSNVEVMTLVSEQFLLAEVMLCIMIFVMGILYLIDAVTVKGSMKIIHFGVAALFGFVLSVCILESNTFEALHGIVGLIFGTVNPFVALMYLFAGIVLLIVAGRFSCRRDRAKEIFYYGFAKYTFASMIGFTYFIYAMAGVIEETSGIRCCLVVLGTILIWGLTVFYCTPGNGRKLLKQFCKKKAA